MTQIKYWLLISTLSFAFPNDGEGYRLIGNSTQDYYMDLESVFEMSFGPWDVLNNFSDVMFSIIFSNNGIFLLLSYYCILI